MRLTVLGLIALSLFIAILPSRKGTRELSSEDKSESVSYSLGKRSPAGKIQHEVKGKLPKTKNLITTPTADGKNQSAPVISEKFPGIDETEERPAIFKDATLSYQNSSRGNASHFPREIQNFINPSSVPKSSASSKSNSQYAPYGMTFSGTPFPNLTSPTTAPTPGTGSSSGTASPVAKPIVLTGLVKPLVGKITSVAPWKNAFTAWAAENCADPKVGIFKTAELLNLGVAPLKEVSLGTDASFTFYPDSQINTKRPQDYSLQVIGCDDYLSRIVTAFDENQHINLSSTLLSFAQVSPVNVSPTEVPNDEFRVLATILENNESSFTNIVDVFNALNSGTMADEFTSRFKGSAPEQLKFALPIVKEVVIPNSFTEGISGVMSVNATHWNPDYQLGVEWYLDGVSSSFGSAWNWTPSGNSKREAYITVRVGLKKDGENRVDTNYPYHSLSFKRPIINAISPIPPVLALDSSIPNLIDTANVPLKISTGIGLINCDSFSSLAITESPVSPRPEEFNIICSQEGTQDYLHSLNPISRNIDGQKSLYLWAKDDLDEISSTPTILTFVLDQTPPVLYFGTFDATYPGNSNFVLNWNISEENAVNSENFLIEFFNGSSWTTLPNISPVSGALNDVALSTTLLLPDADANSARFRLTYKDALGQTTSVTSDTFNIRVPSITASPFANNFGDIPAQSTSPSATITFKNNGEWATSVCGTPSLTGDSAQFTILSENCTGTSLAAIGGSCSVTVKANPSSRQAYNAFLGLTCGSKTSSSTLTVTGGNNVPVLAASSSITLNEDQSHNFTFTPATDLDGDTLTYFIDAAASHGTITSCFSGTSNLSCTFIPTLNYAGTDTFTFQAYDGFNYSAPQTVTVTINPVNDAPTIVTTQSISGDEDTVINFMLNAGSDVENDPLTYSIVTSPANGVINCTARNCTYTPTANYYGSDSFTYKVNDGSLNSAIVTATVTINSINDIPVTAADFSLAVTEDTPKAFNLISGTDIDLPAQSLTHAIITQPSHGTLSGCIEAAPGTDLSCTYTPNSNYYGTDSFTYRICDPFVCSSSNTTVTITVDPTNDAPVMVADQNFAINDTQFIDFTLSGATDVDVPAQTLSYKLISAPSQGTLTGCIDSASWTTGTNCRFTPPINFNGNISFTYKAYDGTDQSTAVSTVTFNISDKTPSPVPSVALASPYYTNVTTVSVTNSSCADIASLYISTNSITPAATAPEWVACSTVAGALSTTLSAINATHTVYVWSKDQYGNVQSTPDSIDVIFDNIPPAMTIITESLLGNTSGNVLFNVTELNASAAQDFRIRYNDGSGWTAWNIASANGPFNQQTFSTSVTVPNADNATLNFEVKYLDLAGNDGIVSGIIRSDMTTPVVDSLSLNGGVAQSKVNSILVNLTAHDDVSRIRFFCLKYNDTTPPTANSSCWKNVTAPTPGIAANKTITFNNYYFQVGFIKAIYNVYVWVKDDVGLISSNAQTLNVDRFDLDYDPGSPPRILAIEAVNSNTPNRPNLPADLSANSGENVFVKWKAEDNEGFAVNPISIEYTLNDVDFFPITGAQTLQNGANGACTVDVGFTGCAVVPSPSNNYFKIRVIAKDDADTTVYLNSEPLNNSRLRIIAGNTEHGLGGSAKTAVYYAYGSGKNNNYLTKHKLAISEDGKFFYLDPVRGLMWIDPSKGTLEVFIPATGSSTGDGGSITSATLASANGITLDPYNNLLIWDNNRIRKVNLSTMTISAVFGGGAVNEPTTVVAASSIKLGGFHNTWATLIPLPNGDIIFSTGTGTRNPYRYRASDQMIEPMILSGQGFDGDPGADWSLYTQLDFGIAYDTASSAISFMTKGFYKYYTGDSYSHYVRILPTGDATTPYPSTAPYDLGFQAQSITTALDGKIYLVNRFRNRVQVYDPVTNTKTTIAGTGTLGTSPCAENTPATSCSIDVDSIFVTKNSRIYFLDQGVLRTIDDNGNILSLFGQFPSYGDGQLATVARFGNIVDLKFGKHSAQNDMLIVSDGFGSQYREFQIDGLTTNLGSNGYSWAGPFRFETDPATGDIMTPRSGVLQRLVRATNTWTTIVGGGGTRYLNADGLVGSDIYFSSYAAHTSGFADGKLYYRTYYWTGTQNQGCQIKAYDSNDSYRQSHFLGTNTNNCAASYSPGTDLATQYIATTYITSFIDPSDGVKKTFFAGPNGRINRVGAGNILEEFLILPRSFSNFSYRFAADGLNIYYCSGQKLYHYNYNSGIESLLPWASTTIKCKGATLYNAERNTVVFSFTQNGLDGVAEYRLD